MRGGSWADAAEAMKNAAELHPAEGGQKIVIANRTLEEYLPYYWLGVSRYNVGVAAFCPTAEACDSSEFIFLEGELTNAQLTKGAIAKAAFARFDGDEFQRAIEAFDASESQGTIRNLPQYATLIN